MKVFGRRILVGLMLGWPALARMQAAAPPTVSPEVDQKIVEAENRMQVISAALAATQQQIDQSQHQMQQLRQELSDLRQQMCTSGVSALAATSSSSTSTANASLDVPAPSMPTDANFVIDEHLQTLDAAVKLHDQTKVESSSKYPVRLSGLILFNSYVNRGVADNDDLPAFALGPTSTSGNGSLGASLRQTIFSIEGDGPRIAGARTSANVSLDFFSSVSYTSYGTSAGVVRMRSASIDFDWLADSLKVGFTTPLIAPLIPDSFATVAEPSLAGAGNLWTWAPELRYAHRFPVHDGRRFQYEFGLWDSPSAGYNPNQLFRTSSPAELAGQPGYETRVSYATAGDRGFQIGVGGYYSRQAYPGYRGYIGTEHLDSWAGTADWRLPISRHFEISGEGYRGRSIAGLGGGVYKDVIAGTSPVNGASILHGLNAIGGWTQFKTRYSSSLETNFSIGQDNGFAGDFHAVALSPTATTTQLRARNRMVVGNLIFRPKSYIILSPEFRRVWSWPITGPANTLDVYTVSIGYQF